MDHRARHFAKKKRLSHDPRYALNAICPYYTMFPLEYPLTVLDKHRNRPRLKLLDPFCGRGSSLYAGRIRGHEVFGIDCSPIAVAIARAKIATCQSDEVVNLAREILSSYRAADIPHGEFWEWAFAKNTLRSLC